MKTPSKLRAFRLVTRATDIWNKNLGLQPKPLMLCKYECWHEYNADFGVHKIQCLKQNSVIIIIFYFENVAFFHAKLGSDVCHRVDNQTSGDTLQELTRPLSGNIAISKISTHERVLVGKYPST